MKINHLIISDYKLGRKIASKIYILILNYNSSEESIALYNSLRDKNKEIVQRILVIDNNSGPDELKFLKNNIPQENLLLSEKNLGYAGGNNLGIKLALADDADYIWILNPDIRIENHSLSLLLETITADEKLAAVGPRILIREATETIFTDGELLHFNEHCSTEHKNSWKKDNDVPEAIDYEIDYIDGSCILVRTDAIRNVGLLPEQYFLYFEETHWCFSAKEKGWKLAVNSNAKVFNLISDKKEIFHYYFMRNRLLFCKRFHKDFKKVRSNYASLLFKEFINSLCRKSYQKPYFKSRLLGYFAGFLRTL